MILLGIAGRQACAAIAACVLALCATTASGAAPHLELDVALDPETRTLKAAARLSGIELERITLERSLSIERIDDPSGVVAAQPDAVIGTRRIWRLSRRASPPVSIAYSGTLAPLAHSADHRSALALDRPMVSPEGSYLPAGTGWYPEPGVRFTHRTTMTLPGAQRGLVEGTLQEEQMAGAHYRARFTMSLPVEGLHLIAGPLRIGERLLARGPAAQPIRIRTYFPAALAALSEAYLEDTARYLERYSGSIGAYPYDSFSVVATPLPVGFGMPTLALIGESVLRLPFIRATSLGHEVLHSWWGNGVGVDASRGNWAEGLTTFLADYAYAEERSEGAARDMRLRWLRDSAAVPPAERRALTSFRSRRHGADAALGYGKAAMLFVMLRDAIGRDAFERGLRRFWEAHRHSDASWDDLRAAFEAVAAMDLAPFFAQWLERSDAPAARIEAATGRRMDDIRVQLALTLAQERPAYRLRLPIGVTSTSGAQSLHWVDFGSARATLELASSTAPASVTLDPELRVWRLLPAEQLPPILRQWIGAAQPVLQIVSAAPEVRQAATALARALFEQRATERSAAGSGHHHVLVVGLHTEVDALLARGSLARPDRLDASAGSAQVWTVAGREDRAPLAIVSARDASSIAALARPLPHYGAQSYLVFDGARAVQRGVWPAPSAAIRVEMR